MLSAWETPASDKTPSTASTLPLTGIPCFSSMDGHGQCMFPSLLGGSAASHLPQAMGKLRHRATHSRSWCFQRPPKPPNPLSPCVGGDKGDPCFPRCSFGGLVGSDSGRTLSSGTHQQGTMDKGLPLVTQLPSPELGRIRHTTAEWGTARGFQQPISTGGRGGGGDEPE